LAKLCCFLFVVSCYKSLLFLSLPGTGPNLSGPPQPLIEGLMQAGKVAQKILNSMKQPNQNNPNMSNPNNQKGLLGEPPNMNNGPNNNFMSNIKCLQKMAENPGMRGPNPGMGNCGNQNQGDGLLGNYQEQGQLSSL